jgi:methionyl-tRNA formyltransferase
MGTPAFAVPALRAVARTCEVVRVVTSPDRPRGRGLETRESEVAAEARSLGLVVEKPANVRDPAVRDALAALEPDLFAVVAFGAILSREMLAVPRLGCVNLHGSLLPEYRGASPVQRALWDGRPWTGVTTIWMDEGVDTGDCILQRWVAIEAHDRADSLAERLAVIGAPLLAESLLLAHAGRSPRRPQPPEGASYARKLRKDDGRVDWALDAVKVWNHQRAVTPWPGATTALAGRRVQITRALPHHWLAVPEPPGTLLAVTGDGLAIACAPGVLMIESVKPEGKADMHAVDWARGARLERGARFEWEKEAHA